MRVVLMLLLIAATSLAAAATPLLPNHAATYSATYNGMPIEVTRELIRTDSGYALTVNAKNWLGNIRETESFHVDAKGALLVDSYHSQRQFLGIARKEKLEVDWTRGLALYDARKKHLEIPLNGDYLGPISYQLQMSRDLSAGRDTFCYRVLMRGKVKDYCFESAGEKMLRTPLGKINTVAMRRIRENDERETLFWLAPEWDYLLVKLWQKEEDGETYEIILSGGRINGEELRPALPR